MTGEGGVDTVVAVVGDDDDDGDDDDSCFFFFCKVDCCLGRLLVGEV
jgi:hypothetical protein